MKYQQFLIIEKQKAFRLSQYLNGTADEPLTENETISFTVPFTGGIEMDIKVCGTDEAAAFSEAVLFTKKGAEICCTEPGEDILGEWSLDYNDNTYEVVVAPGDKQKVFAIPTVYGPNGNSILTPPELAAHANAVHKAAGGKGDPFTSFDFSGENPKSRLRGEGHCYCGTVDGTLNGVSAGIFELLPACDMDVRDSGKAYMFCRCCGGWSHL